MLLASKFDEIDDNIPLIDELCKAYKVVVDSLSLSLERQPREPYLKIREIKICEMEVLNELEWDLNSITPLHFTHMFLY